VFAGPVDLSSGRVAGSERATKKPKDSRRKNFWRNACWAIDLHGDPAKLHPPGTAVERLSASGCSLAIRQLISFGFGRHAIVTGTDLDHHNVTSSEAS
jgi:hypothetical protein